MDDGHSGNAMTEIALALAMGFFSIMVLAIVSMGAGQASMDAPKIEAAALLASEAGSPSAAEVTSEDVLLIYDGAAFRDQNLDPFDVARLPTSGRVILALPAHLSVEDAVEARRQIARDDLIITPLDARWQERLATDGGAK